MPELFIITGSNGAGKSSIGANYLPAHIQNTCSIFDGDKLFMQKQKDLWNSGIRANKEARKISYQFVSDTFDVLVEAALNNKSNFVYEGHFTNDATWEVPQQFKKNGYSINLIFFGLTDPDLSELRVIDRKKEGGHYVDRKTIEDNFYGNLEKLNQYFGILDSLRIIDTSETNHRVLFYIQNNFIKTSVTRADLPGWFTKFLPDIETLIS